MGQALYSYSTQINLMRYLLLSLVLFLHLGTTLADELLDPGELSETFISPQLEKRLSKEFMREVHRHLPLNDDAIINDYIQHLGNKLVTHAPTKRKKFHFLVVNDSSFNAFAGPGANIVINSGTMVTANTESELAAVMSHEIAQVAGHHIERLLENAKNTEMVATAGMLASMIIGSAYGGGRSNSQSGSLVSGVAMASMVGAAQHLINFTREHEIIADNVGMKILYQSSFNPRAMANIFERMHRLHYGYGSEIPSFLLTHPVTSDRIAEAKNRASQYGAVTTEVQDIFSLVRARVLALTANNSPRTIKNLQTQFKQQKKSAAAQYGLALLLCRELKFTQARSIAENLQQKHPHEVLFQMLLAQLTSTDKDLTKTLTILNTALAQHGNYYPLIVQYGETLLASGRATVARDFLRTKIRLYPESKDL